MLDSYKTIVARITNKQGYLHHFYPNLVFRECKTWCFWCSGDAVGDTEKSTKLRQAMDDFVAPRDVLLQLCTTFYVNALFR